MTNRSPRNHSAAAKSFLGEPGAVTRRDVARNRDQNSNAFLRSGARGTTEKVLFVSQLRKSSSAAYASQTIEGMALSKSDGVFEV